MNIINEACQIPTLRIDERECLGDSIGKLNYNFLVYDTFFCNLSTYLSPAIAPISAMNVEIVEFFRSPFTDFISNYRYIMDNASELMSDNFRDNIILASNTVNLLSSFWGHYEFSIQIPINGISFSQEDRQIIAPTLSEPINKQKVDFIVDRTLKGLAEYHLNIFYRPQDYFEGTIINTSFFVYNQIPVLNSPDTIDPLLKVTFLQNNTFSYNKRDMSVSYTRGSIRFTTGVVLRYALVNRKWLYLGYILNNQFYSARPDYNYLVIFDTFDQKLKQTLDQNQNSFLSECKEIEKNKWYSMEEYIYASALYTGTNTKKGAITLTIKTINNDFKIYTHRPNGHNPNSGTGGTDVYVELFNNIINIYEQFPIPKTLVDSFVIPFQNSEGLSFKFNFDNNGVEHTVCASNYM
jgi:hypothetical protein